MLLKLALRNVFRQKARTAVTLLAIVLGVTSLILSGGFVKDIFIQLGEAIIHSQTGHIQVFRHDFIEKGSRQPDRYLIEDSEQLSKRLSKLEGVSSISARLNFAGLLNNGRRDLGIIGEGIEPDKEAKLGSYLSITAGRQLKDSDTHGILLGQGVAHSLSLHPGDPVTLVMNTADGALNTMDFDVIGVFQSFSKDFDARAVRIPLPAARELMGSDSANLLVVSLQHTEATDHIQQALDLQLPQGLESRSWHRLSDFYEKTLELYDRQFGILKLIILCMVLLSVANTVNMSAFERQGEFGTLQAVGNTRSDIFRLIVLENLILGLIGGGLGVIAGIALAELISAIGIPMPPPPNANQGYTAYIRLDAGIIVWAFFIGLLAAVLASLLPARKVAKTPIVDALRQAI